MIPNTSGSSNQLIDKILMTPNPNDRISLVENQIRNVCAYFSAENLKLKEDLAALKEMVFNRVVDSKEIANILKISPGMARRHMENGNIEAYRDGKKWKTTIEKLFYYMKSKPKKYGEGLTLMDVAKYFD